MTRLQLNKLRPTSGLPSLLHVGLTLLLPLAIFVLVRLGFVQLALSVVVLSKWRMVAVRPRFWAANVRANAVDLMVGLSLTLFMAHDGGSFALQFLWAVLYGGWLLWIKPGSSILKVTAQAFIGQFCALMVLFMIWPNGSAFGLTLLVGLFCFLAARHFLDVFEEPYARLLAFLWGYFGASLAWLLSHWLLFYGALAQPTLLLSTLGYGMATLYYLDHNDRLSHAVRRQLIFVMVAIVIVVVAFSDWGDKVV